MRAWHERYAAGGLTIIGVHTPEFFWEKSRDRVAAAVRELGIPYAVVQDNDSAIWKGFGVWAWPTTILVDKQGIVRYSRVGEGGYQETEGRIRRLLMDAQHTSLRD